MKEQSNEMNGFAKGNRSICIRVNLTPYQNKIVEDTMQLQGYTCKSKFVRDSILNNSVSLQKQLAVIYEKLDRLRKGKFS